MFSSFILSFQNVFASAGTLATIMVGLISPGNNYELQKGLLPNPEDSVIMTWNTGGFFRPKTLDGQLETQLRQILENEQPDIFSLQEVFTPKDQKIVAQLGKEYGYTVIQGRIGFEVLGNSFSSGLVTLVRSPNNNEEGLFLVKSISLRPSFLKNGKPFFKDLSDPQRGPLLNRAKGSFLVWVMEGVFPRQAMILLSIENSQPNSRTAFTNVHGTPNVEILSHVAKQTREEQYSKLFQALLNLSPEQAVVIGDFNISPIHELSEDANPNKERFLPFFQANGAEEYKIFQSKLKQFCQQMIPHHDLFSSFEKLNRPSYQDASNTEPDQLFDGIVFCQINISGFMSETHDFEVLGEYDKSSDHYPIIARPTRQKK
jgi:exonuclease III